MTDRPPPRRPAFDEITMGWGSDSEPDLEARLQLAMEWLTSNLTSASQGEQKVLTAMEARLRYYREART